MPQKQMVNALEKKNCNVLSKINQPTKFSVYFYEIIWAKTSFNYRQDYIQH